MNQEQIVIECHRLALELKSNCAAWLHTSSNRRNESAAFELSAAADALYSFLNSNPEIMGSDTGKPAFDQPDDEEFQENMNSLWDQEEPNFRERMMQE